MENQKTKKKQRKQPYLNYIKYSGLAFQMFAIIGIAVWAGFSLDNYFDLKFPAFAVSFVLLAVIGAMISVIKNLPKY